jgi:PIN domain nuclease of toxin-antitoxin system
MNLLLDTHLLLWAAGDPQRLPSPARALIEDPDHVPVYSVASLWEIMIKRSLGRDDFHVDPALLRRGLLDNGWRELPVLAEHVLALGGLPALHRDPFDRLLLAQAQSEGLLLLTRDAALAAYPGPIRVV